MSYLLFCFAYSLCILETFLLSNVGKSQGHFASSLWPWRSDRGTPGLHPGCPGSVPGQGAKICLQDSSLLSLGDPLVQSLLRRSPQTAGCRLLTFTLSTTCLGFPFPCLWHKRSLFYPILSTSEGGLTAASPLQERCQPLRCSPGVLTPWLVPPRPTPAPPEIPPHQATAAPKL